MSEHVYCTDCTNFIHIMRCIDKNIINNEKQCDECPCNNCNCWDFEDSRADRPNYTENDPCKTCGTQRCYPEYCSKLRPELNDWIIHPKVKDGKILLDKNNKDHRYIMEDND